ncbi:hypothetical protein V8C86DRAFT_2524707 [Haematococcus lacustris]
MACLGVLRLAPFLVLATVILATATIPRPMTQVWVRDMATSFINSPSDLLTPMPSTRHPVRMWIKTDFQQHLIGRHWFNSSQPMVIMFGNTDTSPLSSIVHNLLRMPSVLAIFATNCHLHHPKLHHLPIGYNSPGTPGGWGDASFLMRRMSATFNQSRDAMVASFKAKANKAVLPPLGNTHPVRRHVSAWAAASSEIVSVPRKPFKDMLDTMASYRFCICPRGNGLDAHRVWECLLVGSIPVYVSDDPAPGIFAAMDAAALVTSSAAAAKTLARLQAQPVEQHVDFLYRARQFLTTARYTGMLQQVLGSQEQLPDV